MNILMLTSAYPCSDDGAYKVTPTVQYFCQEWVRQGHNVFVVYNNTLFPAFIYHLSPKIKFFLERKKQIQIPPRSYLKDCYFNDNGVNVYRIGMKKIIPHSSFSRHSLKKQADSIINILHKNNFIPDLVLSHWANPQAQLLKILKEKLENSFQSALVFHNECNYKNIRKYKLFECIKYIDAIGCRNRFYAKEIKQLLNLDYLPFVCSSGIDNDIVNNTSIDECIGLKKKNSFLYVGRLVKLKNVDSIFKALNESNSSNYSFEVVGSGTEKDSLLSLCNSLGMQNSTIFVDKLDHLEVFNHMKQAEVFIMISTGEVFGMVYLEAMLMGCITIASKGGAMDGIIVHGNNGFLCESGNESELKNIINTINSLSMEEKEKIMRKAHKTAIEFSDEKVSKAYLESVSRGHNDRNN